MSQPRLICGVDEAGRGPLAGPVYAACVMLDPLKPILGLADSKQLTASKRQTLAEQIKSQARFWSVAYATVEEIDCLNILQASLLAMKRAVDTLSIEPDEVLVDGLYCPQVKFPTRAIVKGDGKIPEIMAASILAKTARDAEMQLLHQRYPQYGFDHHKGYPTAQHLQALKQHGVTIIHRRSYAPVKALFRSGF
ncbi:MAG: ribonuclease HII [Burkholderiales bacterium]